MDWRNRKYFLVKLDPLSYDFRLEQLMRYGVKLHEPYNHIKREHVHSSTYDGDFSSITGISYVQFMLSCKSDDYDSVVYELNKGVRRDDDMKYVELTKEMCRQ